MTKVLFHLESIEKHKNGISFKQFVLTKVEVLFSKSQKLQKLLQILENIYFFINATS